MKNTIRKRSQKRRTVKNQKRRIGGNPEVCPLCLEDMKSPYTNSESYILHKNSNIPHVFHTACILKYLNVSIDHLNVSIDPVNNIQCPICREIIKKHKVRADIETIQTYGVLGLYLIPLANFVNMIVDKIKQQLQTNVRNVVAPLLESDIAMDIAMVTVPILWLYILIIVRKIFPDNHGGSKSLRKIPEFFRSKSLTNVSASRSSPRSKSASRSLKTKSVTPQITDFDSMLKHFKDLIKVKKINENTCIKETSRNKETSGNKELYEVVISAKELKKLLKENDITEDKLTKYMKELENTPEYQKIKNMYIFGNIL
jgi:hypothetical protein